MTNKATNAQSAAAPATAANNVTPKAEAPKSVNGVTIERGLSIPADTGVAPGKWKTVIGSMDIGDSFLFPRKDKKRDNSGSYAVKQAALKLKRKVHFVKISDTQDRVFRINDDGTIPQGTPSDAQ